MPRPTAAVVVPTAARPGYLDVTLGSIAPQAAALGAEVVVVDDGPSAGTREVALAHGATYLPHERPRGPNAARNTGLAHLGACAPGGAPLDAGAAPAGDPAEDGPADGSAPAGDPAAQRPAVGGRAPEAIVFVDDDVRAPAGWLAALLAAAATEPGADVLGGPITAVVERPRRHRSGRYGEPLTALDLGPEDHDVPRVWSANLLLRAATTRRLGGFDERLEIYGDEEELQERVLRAGGRVRYAAAAGLVHRRDARDGAPAALARAQRFRGRQARRWDARRGVAPGAGAEAALAARCAASTLRHRDADGWWATAQALGRLEEAVLGYPPPGPRNADPDFLSGTSGEVGGRRGRLLRAHDAWLDLAARRRGHAGALDAAAARSPVRRVFAVVPARAAHAERVERITRALGASRHDVAVHAADPAGRPKFRLVDEVVAAARGAAPTGLPDGTDWLLVCDDDVDLPPRFLDRLLAAAEALDLALAQPAHRRHGHAAWEVTRRSPDAGLLARETTFVEIGPVTLIRADAAARLLPFPAEAGMGWGLDNHWSAVALAHGLRLGVVDAVPVGHTHAPAGSGYARETAVADGRALLAARPYVRRHEVRTLRGHRALPTLPGGTT